MRLISLVFCEIEVVIMLVIYKYAYVVFTMFFMVEFYYNNIIIFLIEDVSKRSANYVFWVTR
jgi:hypothetical protein